MRGAELVVLRPGLVEVRQALRAADALRVHGVHLLRVRPVRKQHVFFQRLHYVVVYFYEDI